MKKIILILLFTVIVCSNEVNATNTSQWLYDGQHWQLTDEQGQLYKNKWFHQYYFDQNGFMLTDTFVQWDNETYYVDHDGKYVNDKWQYINNKWYYFAKFGAMKRSDWVQGYYLQDDGTMATNQFISYRNETYYVDNEGKYINEKWQYINNNWYYFAKFGAMQRNTWVKGYYLQDDGTMAINTWVGPYYVDQTGAYVHGRWQQIDSYWYYFNLNGETVKNKWVAGYFVNPDGKMATNQWYYDSDWYWFNEKGLLAKNQQIQYNNKTYYLKSNGKMASNEWINNQFYNDQGELVENYTHRQQGTSRKIVFLDPGHGGGHYGAAYYGLVEKDLNLQIFKKLRNELEKKGFTVLASRQDDSQIDLLPRSQMANQSLADIFISIHFNASGNGYFANSGIETYWYEYDQNYQPKINQLYHNDPLRLKFSEQLAKAIHSNLLSTTGANDRGIRRDTFAVLRETEIPAVLLELGYMDDPIQSKLIGSSAYQDKLVKGIVNGILAYYQQLQ